MPFALDKKPKYAYVFSRLHSQVSCFNCSIHFVSAIGDHYVCILFQQVKNTERTLLKGGCSEDIGVSIL